MSLEYVLRQLSSSIVLSEDDISAIRQAIAHRYGQQPKERQALYLAQALHKAVEKALVGIEHHFWQQIKQTLFKNTLAKQKLEITKRDVFHEIVNLDLDVNDLSNSAYRWLVTQQVEGVDPADLSHYVKRHFILQGKPLMTTNQPAVQPVNKKEAESWLVIETREKRPVSTIEEAKDASTEALLQEPNLEASEKPSKGKIKSLEPAPHIGGEEDWPVSYRLSHLGWAVIGAAIIMGLSMTYTLIK